jgi:hypothetical protein
MPYTVPSGDFVAIKADSAYSDQLGDRVALEINADDPTELVADGDHTGGVCAVGRTFHSEFQFTKPFPYSSGADASQIDPITQGRLQVRDFSILVRGSAGFEARVTSVEIPVAEQTEVPEEYVYEYPEKYVDQTVVGPATAENTEKFTFDVGMRSIHVKITITSDSHLPLNINGAEWNGYYVSQAART